MSKTIYPEAGAVLHSEHLTKEQEFLQNRFQNNYQDLVGSSGVVKGGGVSLINADDGNSGTLEKLKIEETIAYDSTGRRIHIPAHERDLRRVGGVSTGGITQATYKIVIRYKPKPTTQNGVSFITDFYEVVERDNNLQAGDVALAEVNAQDIAKVVVTSLLSIDKRIVQQAEVLGHFPLEGLIGISVSFKNKTLAQLKKFLLGEITDNNDNLDPKAPKTNPLTNSVYNKAELEGLEKAKKLYVKIKGGGGSGGGIPASIENGNGISCGAGGGGGAGFEHDFLLDIDSTEVISFVLGAGGVTTAATNVQSSVNFYGNDGGTGGASILRKNNVIASSVQGGYPGGFGGYRKDILTYSTRVYLKLDGIGGLGFPNGDRAGFSGTASNTIGRTAGNGAVGWYSLIGGGGSGVAGFNSVAAAGYPGQAGGMILQW